MRNPRSKAARTLAFALNSLRWGLPARSLLFGPLSLGDDLLCTAVLREARQRGRPFTMMTARPELFRGNHDPAKVIPIDDDYVAGLRRLSRKVVKPYYVRANPENPDGDLLPQHHVIVEMCRLAGLEGDVAVRPYLNLTPEEKRAARRQRPVIALQSSVLAARIPYPTKEWIAKSWQTVAIQLRRHAYLVQLGTAADPALPVDEDLRGKTSLREAAAILANARVFVGLEGFLTHLARAVDCPAVVVMGGRARASVFGYVANTNLTATPPCSPCGLRTGCPHDLACMQQISAETVITAALDRLAHPPASPLPVDTIRIPAKSNGHD